MQLPNLTYQFFSPSEAQKRLEELILYISEKSQNDPKFGSIKLNKIIMRADRLQYINTGKSISGDSYKKVTFGPVPLHSYPAQLSLIERNDLILQPIIYFNQTQKRPIPLRRADTSLFRGDEIALIDAIIDEMKDDDGRTSSDKSHDRKYDICEMNSLIPYEYIFISDQPLTAEDIQRTNELNEKYGWERTTS